MSTKEENMEQLAKAGTLSLSEIESMFASAPESNAAANTVTATDWGVCYSSATGELSEYATVNSNNAGNPITGIGMLAYSGDGSKLYAAQYTNFVSGTSIGTSVGTTLFNPAWGNSVLCVLYGWTEQGNFYLTKTIAIVPCQ